MANLDINELEACMNSLGKKFLMYPYNFFTETDAHSFLFYYMFRYAKRGFKIQYPSKDKDRAVLIHREYPTVFKYMKKDMVRDPHGTRGHYDLVVLNPDYMQAHAMPEIMMANFNDIDSEDPLNLFAAIEFKLVKSPLDKGMQGEIVNDITKLSWALEPWKDRWPRQSINTYALIFNRSRWSDPEKQNEFYDEITKASKHTQVRVLYIESVPGNKKHSDVKYLNDWTDKITLKKTHNK